ncbi:MAG: hypothetical protein COA80_00135 [Leeuwenhoekiella sp.]|nr:MAG: hypothetical protein COA80_00135 [Leeuwenhoekiella sp.]
MKEFKSHFELDNRQRNGILFLVLLVIGCWALYFFVEPAQNDSYSKAVNENQLKIFEARIDSIQKLRDSINQPKIYPFNPNFITDYKGYTLGMNVEEIDRLLRFRESGKWINSAEDFQQVTGVSDSLLAAIAPYFKFPEWVNKPKTEDKPFKKEVEFPGSKSDLNTVSFEELMKLEELDQAIAKRILDYRRKLGGFLDDRQLYDVYGISKDQVKQLQSRYTVLSKPEIKRIDVNKANASDLSTVPFITFEIAREIVNYRLLHNQINDLDELLKIDGITPYKLDRIKLYLSSNQN